MYHPAFLLNDQQITHIIRSGNYPLITNPLFLQKKPKKPTTNQLITCITRILTSLCPIGTIAVGFYLFIFPPKVCPSQLQSAM